MASRTRFIGPVVDLEVGGARAEASGENLPFGTKIYGEGWEAILVRVDAAAGAIHGAFCFVDIEDTAADWEAQPATDTNAAALNAATRPLAICGFLQTDTQETDPTTSAADNDAAWLVTVNLNPNAGLFAINDGAAAIAQFGQVTTTATAGEINDAAGVGTFDISNVGVVTATTGPVGGAVASGITWENPRLAAVAN
jgi:hypothetical protein